MDILAYHTYIPSFGDWGFILAGFGIAEHPKRSLPQGLRYWTKSSLETAERFAADEDKIPVEVNSILNHVLVEYYHEGWSTYFR